MTAAISVTELTKSYGKRPVLKGISLDVAPGERMALLGPNGAGKTTLIKLMLGLTKPDSGTISVLGGRPGTRSARLACAYLPENVSFHKSLTGREQLTLFARLKGESGSAVIALLERVGLVDAMDARISTYSKGMRQRLGLAQVLIGRPRIAILDEPTSGLDPLSREQFYATISELAEDGTAVLLSSHALTEIEARTDKIAILSRGQIVACDSLPRLRKNAGLPVRMRVEARPERADEVAERLGGIRINGRAVEISCDAGSKLSRLGDIAELGRQVEDVDLLPPSLEDVYRFYSSGASEEDRS